MPPGASVHGSGQTYQTGRITKQERRKRFGWLSKTTRIGKHRLSAWRLGWARAKRMGAIARKLLVVMRSGHVPDRCPEMPAVARICLRWGKNVGTEQRQGLTFARSRQEFITTFFLLPCNWNTCEGCLAPLMIRSPRMRWIPGRRVLGWPLLHLLQQMGLLSAVGVIYAGTAGVVGNCYPGANPQLAALHASDGSHLWQFQSDAMGAVPRV